MRGRPRRQHEGQPKRTEVAPPTFAPPSPTGLTPPGDSRRSRARARRTDHGNALARPLGMPNPAACSRRSRARARARGRITRRDHGERGRVTGDRFTGHGSRITGRPGSRGTGSRGTGNGRWRDPITGTGEGMHPPRGWARNRRARSSASVSRPPDRARRLRAARPSPSASREGEDPRARRRPIGDPSARGCP